MSIFAGVYYSYRLVRGVVSGELVVAYAHARAILDLEHGAGLLFEPGLQRWALGESWLIDGANWLYVNSQFLITTSFLIWLYFARNKAFYYVRNMFVIAMGLALVGYLVFPTAPPRLLPQWGFTDTVANWIGQSGSSAASVLYNPYAAIPSMHVAFALMIGIPAIRLVRNRVVKLLWAFYPVLITLVVLVTANHFWFDAVLGAAVAAASSYAAHAALARARPEAWSWRSTLGAEAPA
ncbi:MAG: hypothetical protein NVSMB25_04020 [Thermoleophilaceae bacterium]